VTALKGRGVSVSGHVYGLGGRDLHPEDVREVFAGLAESYIGLRGLPCPA
jgi:pyruvate/2-oxoacid:ferredoxin oxidoreductase alpha subunit